jgi:hypothetical protein
MLSCVSFAGLVAASDRARFTKRRKLLRHGRATFEPNKPLDFDMAGVPVLIH